MGAGSPHVFRERSQGSEKLCQVHKLLERRATVGQVMAKARGPVGIRARGPRARAGRAAGSGVDPGPGLRMEALKFQGWRRKQSRAGQKPRPSEECWGAKQIRAHQGQ